MVDIAPVRTSQTVADSKQWLGSEHGDDSLLSGTVDVSTFTGVTGLIVNGVIPSGVPVKYNATSKLWECSFTNATPSPATGHLREEVRLSRDATGAVTSTRALCSVLWHGVVVLAKVPVGTAAAAFLKANGPTTVYYL